jgi:hypothetical protein
VGGAIVLAHGVDGRGAAEAALVLGERRGSKKLRPCLVFDSFFSMK